MHAGFIGAPGCVWASRVVYVGRVLHFPQRCPTMLECAKLCLGRDPNVRPSNVEVVLGNL